MSDHPDRRRGPTKPRANGRRLEDQEHWTVEELALYYRCSEAYVRKCIKLGVLKVIRLGTSDGDIRIRRAEALAFGVASNLS